MPSLPPTFDLPQELIDTLIDQVQDCPHTLRSCSLVARLWLPRSRVHLFKRIVVSSAKQGQEPGSVELFRNRLQTLLNYSSSSRLCPPLEEVTETLLINTSGLFSSTEVLNEFLPVLPFSRLRTVSIQASPDHPLDQTALLILLAKNTELASLTMMAIMLHDVIDFLHLFVQMRAHPHLRSLSLRYIYMNHRPEESKAALRNTIGSLPLLDRQRPLLHSLQLGTIWGMPDLLTEPLFTHSHSLFDLSALQVLDIYSFGALRRYSELLQSFGQNIRTLRLGLATHNMNFEPSDWTFLTNLKTLELTVFYEYPQVIDKLASLIDSSLSFLPRLERFAFGFYYYRTPSDPDFSQTFWNDTSSRIDPVLARLPDQLQYLKEIVVDVLDDYNPGIEVLNSFFSQTYSSGRLNFNIQDHQMVL